MTEKGRPRKRPFFITKLRYRYEHACSARSTDVADSLFNLAVVYEKKEELGKVVDCYQQVYNIESKIFEQDHTQVKKTLEALNKAKHNLA